MLRDGIDLRAPESQRTNREGICVDIKAVLVGADQRLIAEAGASAKDAVAIVRDIELEDVPTARRIVRLADSDKDL